MPKRTKKQKLLADLRRQKITNLQFSLQTVKPQIDTPAQTLATMDKTVADIKIGTVIKPNSHVTPVDYTHVKNDLLRIFIFTLAALVFQGVLYFVLYRV